MKEVPDGSILPTPHAVGEGDKAQEDFYQLALSRARYISDAESEEWFSKAFGKHCKGLAAVLVARDSEKRVSAIDLVVVRPLFNIDGESYEDLIPFVAEHELYESWLLVKDDARAPLSGDERHAAARRREFLFAEAGGKSERLAKWYSLALRRSGAEPETLSKYRHECIEAIDYARSHPQEVADIRLKASW